MRLYNTAVAVLAIISCLMLAADLSFGQQLPADRAGSITPPTGQIAFIRDGSIWAMKADGTDQQMICEVTNADGRLTWSADNKEIMFTRSGFVNMEGPDLLGGRHKIYDLFKCFMDSAYANNRLFWLRITEDLGNRGPEWTWEGNRVLFWKDMNANQVNAQIPNYQICTMDPDGMNIELLRKDWQNFTNQFLISPSLSKDGNLAFVYFQGTRQVGLAAIPLSKVMMSMDSISALAEQNRGYVAPAWSPDGKWVAMVSNNMEDAGLYIATPDLKERFLVTTPPVGTYLNSFAPSFSPDSKWVTFSTTDGSIWISDITGNGTRRLTGPGTDKAPAWSK